MKRRYLLILDDDESPADAVTVGVSGGVNLVDPLGVGPFPTASVWWGETMHQGDKIQARMEGPFEPAVALDFADVIAERYGFKQVVVAIEDRSLWNAAWGDLVED